MMDDLTGFQRDVLYVTAGLDEGSEPPHGLAIKDELAQSYAGEINHGRLYPNLNTLTDMGFLEKGEIDDRTNFYSLTKRGERELEARYEWEQQYISFEE